MGSSVSPARPAFPISTLIFDIMIKRLIHLSVSSAHRNVARTKRLFGAGKRLRRSSTAHHCLPTAASPSQHRKRKMSERDGTALETYPPQARRSRSGLTVTGSSRVTRFDFFSKARAKQWSLSVNSMSVAITSAGSALPARLVHWAAGPVGPIRGRCKSNAQEAPSERPSRRPSRLGSRR